MKSRFFMYTLQSVTHTKKHYLYYSIVEEISSLIPLLKNGDKGSFWTKYTKSKWKRNGFSNERNNEGVMGTQRNENTINSLSIKYDSWKCDFRLDNAPVQHKEESCNERHLIWRQVDRDIALTLMTLCFILFIASI